MSSSNRSSSRSSSNKKKPFINTFDELIAYGRNRTNPDNSKDSHDPSIEEHTLNRKTMLELFALNQYAFTFYSTNDGDKTYSIEFAIPKKFASKFAKKLKQAGYWFIIYPHNIGNWDNDETISNEVITHYDKNKIHKTYLIRIENNDPNVFDSGRYYVRTPENPNGWYRDSPTTIAFNKRIYFIDDPINSVVDWSVFDEVNKIAKPEVYTELVGVVVEDPKIGRKSLYRELTKILHDINNPPKRSSSRTSSNSLLQSLKNIVLNKK
jgi:hypothetical protein